MIKDLVQRKVATTLALFEAKQPDARRSRWMRLTLAAEYPDQLDAATLEKDVEFEYAFVKAGGHLIAGADPSGNGGAMPGFADQPNIVLLVEAGFTAEAIRVYTLNAAQYLGEADRIGTIANGKAADLVVVNGDPSKKVTDIEKMTVVFRDGFGYDTQKLIKSVDHAVGLY